MKIEKFIFKNEKIKNASKGLFFTILKCENGFPFNELKKS